MSETRIKIKELEMNGETAIRIAECLKKHEPEIWKVLSEELKQALRIHDVVGQSEQHHCELYDFGRKDKPCDKQCDSCKAMNLD